MEAEPSSSGLEKGIITDFAKKARSQLIKEGSFTAARALDFFVCGTINEPHLPAEGSIPNQFLCVRCDQKVLATRKHELWECPGNTLINHTHMMESEYLTSLAQEFWDTDQVLFARGLLPRDWFFFFAKCGTRERNQSVTHGSKDKKRRLTSRRGRPNRVRGRRQSRGGRRLARPPAKQRRPWHTRRQASCSTGASIPRMQNATRCAALHVHGQLQDCPRTPSLPCSISPPSPMRRPPIGSALTQGVRRTSWESVDFNACAKNHVLFASDGSGKSEDSPNTETGRIWSGHLLSTCTSATTPPSLYSKLAIWEVRCPASRRFHEPNSGEPSKFSAKSMGRRTSKFRLMRNT